MFADLFGKTRSQNIDKTLNSSLDLSLTNTHIINLFSLSNMKKQALILCCALFCANLIFGQTLYVKAGENGNGYSWENALGDLQKALAIATPGTQIWVAKGTYFPVDCKQCTPEERSTAFQVPNGVQLYGGFAGYEAILDDRMWKFNATILSGNIGQEEASDNSQTIVYFENVDENTLLDGFFISDGSAQNEGKPGNRDRSGAGIFNECTAMGASSTPIISNCTFMDNSAREGAAIFNHSEKGTAVTKITKCTFIRNKAGLAGGAILDNLLDAKRHSSISECFFVKNEAVYGGAYFSNHVSEESLIFQDCNFIRNHAQMGASGFLITGGNEINWQPANCVFKNNTANEEATFMLYKGNHLPKLPMKGMTTKGI